jgi:hypothetical protein
VPATTGHPLADLVDFLQEFDARFAGSCLEIVGCLLATRTDPWAMALHRGRVVAPRKNAPISVAARARETGLLRADTDLELLVEMLVGAVFARRIAGVPDGEEWATRAVEAACAGVATPAGLALLRRASRGRRAGGVRS